MGKKYFDETIVTKDILPKTEGYNIGDREKPYDQIFVNTIDLPHDTTLTSDGTNLLFSTLNGGTILISEDNDTDIGPGLGNVFYVSKAVTDVMTDVAPTGSAVNPFTSLTQAIALIPEGSIVYIAPGDYSNETILFTKSLSLIGLSLPTMTILPVIEMPINNNDNAYIFENFTTAQLKLDPGTNTNARIVINRLFCINTAGEALVLGVPQANYRISYLTAIGTTNAIAYNDGSIIQYIRNSEITGAVNGILCNLAVFGIFNEISNTSINGVNASIDSIGSRHPTFLTISNNDFAASTSCLNKLVFKIGQTIISDNRFIILNAGNMINISNGNSSLLPCAIFIKNNIFSSPHTGGGVVAVNINGPAIPNTLRVSIINNEFNLRTGNTAINNANAIVTVLQGGNYATLDPVGNTGVVTTITAI